jgi:hypothetical protein
VIEGQPVDFPYQIRVTDRKIQAFHILFPVPMAHNSVGDERMQAASHGVGFPAMPEIMNSRVLLPLDTDKFMSDH